MAFYRVVYEIEVEADSPLEAAQTVRDLVKDHDHQGQWYVQNDDEPAVYSVDLDEEDEDAVLFVEQYQPLIYY